MDETKQETSVALMENTDQDSFTYNTAYIPPHLRDNKQLFTLD